jgi:hypothetical protein
LTERLCRCLRIQGQPSLLESSGTSPQTDYDTGKPQERGFSLVLERVGAEEIEAKLLREMRYDSDLWAVEIDLGAVQIEEMISISQ